MDETGSTELADLVAVGIGAVLALAAVLFLPEANPLRVGLGLTLALGLPGYGFVTALLPRTGDPDNGDIGRLDRVALTFGASLAVTILVAIALSVSGVGLVLVPLSAILTAFTLLGVVLAAWRRRRLPASERFGIVPANWRAAARAQTVDADPLDRALTGLVIVSIVVLVTSVLFSGPLAGALASATGSDAPSDPAFTEAFLLNTSGGQPIADEYPTRLQPLETATLTVGLTNREGERVDYTVLVLAQHVENGTVVDSRQLHRFTPTLEPNLRWQRDHLVRPTFEGRVRLQYLVYRGEPPTTPTVENAYRELHVWVQTT